MNATAVGLSENSNSRRPRAPTGPFNREGQRGETLEAVGRNPQQKYERHIREMNFPDQILISDSFC